MNSDPKIIKLGQLGPASIEAEEAVLGALLIHPAILDELAEFLRVEDFFELKHRWIFETMLDLARRRMEIDNISLADALQGRKDRDGQSLLDLIGGPAFITYLINTTGTHLNAETYARLVEAAAVRRRLLESAGEIAQLARSENAELNDISIKAEAALSRALERRGERQATTIADAASAFYSEIERRYHDPASAIGIPFGYSDLDDITLGLHKGELTIVGGRTGMGKTALLLNVARNLMRSKQFRVVFFSLEMSEEALLGRLIAMETGINSQFLQSGKLTEEQWELFTEATSRVTQWAGFIEYTPGATMRRLTRRCACLQREYGLDLVVIDYLQLAKADKDTENRVQELSEISREAKQLAMLLRVPVLAAAQVNRQVEARSDKRPTLSDLRESGSLEQDADNVLFLYRDVVYNPETLWPLQAEIIVAKQRNGPTGTAYLNYQPGLTRFTTIVR